MTQYVVNTEEDLDSFEDQEAYWRHSDNYSVLVESTGKVYLPCYCFRENGDMDGFMGWSYG